MAVLPLGESIVSVEAEGRTIWLQSDGTASGRVHCVCGWEDSMVTKWWYCLWASPLGLWRGGRHGYKVGVLPMGESIVSVEGRTAWLQSGSTADGRVHWVCGGDDGMVIINSVAALMSKEESIRPGVKVDMVNLPKAVTSGWDQPVRSSRGRCRLTGRPWVRTIVEG